MDRLSMFGRGAAVASLAAASAALIGWYANIPILTRLATDLPAMQAVTAFAFLSVSVALLLPERPSARRLLGVVVLAIGLATVSGFLLEVTVPLYRLLGLPALHRGPLEPLPMAPTSGVGFCFLGLALLLLRRRVHGEVPAVALALLGIGAAALGAQDVLRFAARVAGLPPAAGMQMALLTAVGFVLLGTACALEATRLIPERHPARMRTALVTGCAALAVTLVVSHVIRTQQVRQIQRATRDAATLLASQLAVQAQNGPAAGAGAVDWSAWLSAALDSAAADYVVEVVAEGVPWYQRGEPRLPAQPQFVETVPLRLAGRQATLSLSPTRSLLTDLRRPLALAVLAMGATLALLLGISLQAGETARARAGRLEEALGSLAAEMNERKRAEAALAESETRLHESRKMEAVARLAGGVAHEFNNLLSVIRGYAQLLEAEEDEHERREFVSEIDEASARGADLTRRLLTVSSRHVLNPRAIDLGAALRDMEGRLGRVLGGSADLRIEVANDTLVFVDPEGFEESLVTLAQNARDAMSEGGTLLLHVAPCTVDSTLATVVGVRPGTFVQLDVSDTGVGIAAEKLRGIFEPFGERTPLTPGAGLGLAMLYGFVRQSGGAIHVASAPGRGTTFRILLPCATDLHIAPSAPNAAPARPRSGRILVAEDEDAVRGLVVRLLRRAGYDVVAARNGVEALSLVNGREDEIDLLLTDVVMPELGGAELAAALRARRADLPVLFMSGYADDAIPAELRPSNGAAFVQKPFATRILLARVDAMLPGSPSPLTPGVQSTARAAASEI